MSPNTQEQMTLKQNIVIQHIFDVQMSPFDVKMSPFDVKLSPFDVEMSPFDVEMSFK